MTENTRSEADIARVAEIEIEEGVVDQQSAASAAALPDDASDAGKPTTDHAPEGRPAEPLAKR